MVCFAFFFSPSHPPHPSHTLIIYLIERRIRYPPIQDTRTTQRLDGERRGGEKKRKEIEGNRRLILFFRKKRMMETKKTD
jgi:hypothetical protein